MSLMERVREIGADEADTTDESVRLARSALSREISRSGQPERVRRTRRRWAGIGIGGLVAGATATAIVIGSVLAPVDAPTASAADALNAAADATLTAAVLDPAPGQYIRIQEVSTQELGWTSDPSLPERGYLDGRGSATEATVRQARSLYVPADRSQDWVEDYDESTEVLEVSGPDAAAARAVLESEGAGPRMGVQVYPGGMYTQTGVGAEGVDPEDVLTFSRNALACYYDEMPRDPEELVAWLDDSSYEYLSDCPPPQLGEPIDFNLAPADLRAAMFQALALVPGAHIERVEGDITTVAFPEGGESDWMQTVDVDTSQGLIVGRGNLEDDSWSSRIHITVIDQIPASVNVPQP
ncbi:hypothetical protein [Microbacterium murale]|uniref:CU044_5270 family protein n=1 Tax=Microbacterium murale TaxID=1081040 RepID=A0ABU0P3L9_9MICO|nr:hypothetical protein [Microbacterium murale]MDQ0641942.1 hypothetical protein [Microbacterium murale]